MQLTKLLRNLKRPEWFRILEKPVHNRFACSGENIATVSQSVAENPNVSIPRRSHELGLSYGTLCRILHLNLNLHPYNPAHATTEAS